MTYKIAVPTKECQGMDVEEHGVVVGSYTARNGHIEVENRRHAKALAAMAGSGMSEVGTFSEATIPSEFCRECGKEHFIMFLVEGLCWRCRPKENDGKS